LPIAFTISPVALGVTATSSDPTIVQNADILPGGMGASRTVSITPVAGLAKTTTIAITLTITDGAKTASTTFTVTVSPSC
jgi:uncharacterized protein YjdB